MHGTEQARVIAEKAMKDMPDKKSEINDLLELCIMEIEDGESAEHEIELMEGDIQQLKD